MFNFKKLVERYSKEPVHILRAEEGSYEAGGIWVDGQVAEIPLKGAVVPLSNQDLKYDINGSYRAEDRKLYTYTEIEKGEQVKHKGLLYTVQEKRDYTDFDQGLNIYFIKRADGNEF